MAESSQDLREQVARLLYEAFQTSGSKGWIKSHTMADSLLPLFAARERAAAEKGWSEAVSSMRYPDGSSVEIIANINPYTVRAQLEGEEA